MAVQTITNPKEQTVNVVVAPGQTIAFDFNLDTATFERSGNDLTVSLDGGGQIVIGDFFVADDIANLPPLQLADGTQVNSGDFLSAFEVDITPAAAATPSSGINAYNDGTGDLVGGLGLSDSLDTFYWGADTAVPQEFDGAVIPLGGAPTPPTGLYYDARAVLYEPTPGDYTNGQLAFNINLSGSGQDSVATILSSQNGYVSLGTLTYDHVNGYYRVDVSDEALTQMQSSSDQLYDYIQVLGPDGTMYTIQVVLNQSGRFDSAYEDSINQPDSNFKGEWHTQNSYTRDIETSSSDRASPGDEVWLAGMTALSGTNNSVFTNSGADTVKIASGILASGTGQNTINTGQDAGDVLSVGGNVVASSGGANNLISGSIEVNAESGEGALVAKGGTNTLEASGDITVDMDTDPGDDSVGVTAIKKDDVGGHNIINSDAGTVAVNVTGSGGDAVGATAGELSSNIITAGDKVNIDVKLADASGAVAYGVEAFDGGRNTITAENGADIKVEAETAREAVGLFVEEEGDNTVKVTNGDLNVEVSNDYGVAMGMKAGTSHAMNSNYAARNELSASDDVKITLNAKYGVMQGMNSQNTIADGQHGNFINAGGDVIIDASDTEAMYAYGMNAIDSGHNEINAITGRALIEAYGESGASGMSAGRNNHNTGTADNIIKAAHTELLVSSKEGIAYGMQATAGGSNEIGDANSKSVKVEAQSEESEAYALWTNASDAKNIISVNGEKSLEPSVSIKAEGRNANPNEEVAGLFAEMGENKVVAELGNIELTAHADAGRASGMKAGDSHAGDPQYQARNELTTHDGNIELNVTSDLGTAYGMSAQHTGTAEGLPGERLYGNFIDAGGDVTINAGDATTIVSYGMQAADNGYNLITATGKVDINVIGDLDATGMMSSEANMSGSKAMNVIDAPTVSINASANEGNAYAMWAGIGGRNDINGVTVTLTASSINGDAFAMYAEEKGVNFIQLEAGGTVTLNGEVYAETGGSNEIVGSTGNDTFILNGKIGADALLIDGGGGEDTLVLKAENWADFESCYDGWLSSVTDTLSVSSIEVNLPTDADYNQVMGYLDGLFGSRPDIVVSWGLGESDNMYDVLGTEVYHTSGGLGFDTLNVSVLGDSTLSDIADKFSGFEHIDLSGNGANKLTIDSLLDGMRINEEVPGFEGKTALLISGTSSEDSVVFELNSDWSRDGTTTYDYGTSTYDVYINNQDTTQYLLIQQGLV